MPGSWYLATDMQLYLLTPFLVVLLQRYPKPFIYFSSVFLSIDFFNLAKYSKLFHVEDKYFTVRARISPWLIGIVFAYVQLKMRSDKSFLIPKVVNNIKETAIAEI